jgi:LPS-assembly lipoprotein
MCKLTAPLALAVLTLTACGFHLRGAVTVPAELSPVYVESKGGSEVRTAMLRSLDAGQIPQASSAAQARTLIRVLGESRSSRVAAVDRSGKVLARELRLRVAFDAVGPDGVERMKEKTLYLTRTFNNADVEVLGKALEEDLIYQDLADDAAERILAGLGAALL